MGIADGEQAHECPLLQARMLQTNMYLATTAFKVTNIFVFCYPKLLIKICTSQHVAPRARQP